MLMTAKRGETPVFVQQHRPRDNWPLLLIWNLLQRHKLVIAACVGFFLCMGLLYLAVAPARYTAIAALVVDTKRSHGFQSETAPDALVDIAVVESQVETIKAERIALSVIQKLKLEEDPEFTGNQFLTSASTSIDALQNDNTRPTIATVRRLLSDFKAALSFDLLGRSSRENLENEKLQRALAKFKRVLSVRRLGQSYVVEIAFTSVNPNKAAKIANEVAKAYIQDQLDARIEQSRQAGAWLQDRIQELSRQMSNAFRTVETFKSENAAATREGQVRLRELDAQAQTYKSIYEGFLSRYVQTIQQQSFPVTDARIVTEALPPLTPSSPKVLFTIALSLVGGFSLGLLAALIMEQRHAKLAKLS